jgi:flagellar hook-basal body complex protein FliE
MSQLAINQVLAQIRTLAPTAPQTKSTSGAVPSATQFGDLLRKSLDAVNSSQQSASAMADAFQRGDKTVDLASVMLESQKASVSFRALTEVRNRLVNVYQDIMNMPV